MTYFIAGDLPYTPSGSAAQFKNVPDIFVTFHVQVGIHVLLKRKKPATDVAGFRFNSKRTIQDSIADNAHIAESLIS